jgi:hypothetical protein
VIGLLIGIFLGVCVTLLLYSTIAGERINNLEYQNEVLNTGKYECSAVYIESIQQYARDIDCYEIFIESLEYAKTGER